MELYRQNFHLNFYEWHLDLWSGFILNETAFCGDGDWSDAFHTEMEKQQRYSLIATSVIGFESRAQALI